MNAEDIKLAQIEWEIKQTIARSLRGQPLELVTPRAQWDAVVAAYETAGMKRSAAIVAAGHARPDLYRQQLTPKAQFSAR